MKYGGRNVFEIKFLHVNELSYMFSNSFKTLAKKEMFMKGSSFYRGGCIMISVVIDFVTSVMW